MTRDNTLANIVAGTPAHPDPNIPQRRAAHPDDDVWVSASAGSGKTKVLTDRVLRLLLPDPEGRWSGARPHKILCITFTKAAAALMALRVQKRLADWAVMGDAELRADLQDNLLGFDPPPHMMAAAKRLFSEVLDVPGGLAIMTIHSFCQSILGRFPIEAGLSPAFQVMDEAKADMALSQVILSTIRHLQSGEGDDAFVSSFERLATYMDMDTLQETLKGLLSDTWNLKAFLKGKPTRADLFAALLNQLGLDSTTTEDDIWAEFPKSQLRDDMLSLAVGLAGSHTATDKKNGQKIADWLALSAEEQRRHYSMFKSALITATKHTPQKIYAASNNPQLDVWADTVRAAMAIHEDTIARLTQAAQTADLLNITAYCLDAYTARKQGMNVLDFSDLILRTRALLERGNLDWVHYKLDEGIDHILVDEAQDTNIHQWKIVELLSDEFTAGWGQGDDRPRSFFVVGDEKQSIFSFHGADPHAFQTMRSFFKKRSEEQGRNFELVPLETSFRTTAPILRLVDTVFEPFDLASHIGIKAGEALVHYTKRPLDAGYAECWPLAEKKKPEKTEGSVQWVLPPVSPEDVRDAALNGTGSSTGGGALASQMALHIAGLLNGKEKLLSADRVIEPRDILVLVRTRSGFVSDLVRNLKRLNVPVSGVDRMQLNDQIAVMDCLALARFARFPADDLALACVLRSPFVRLSENELMDIALGRPATLWDSLQHKGPVPIVRWLQRIIARAALKKPFEFFDEILNEPSPRSGFTSCWQAFLQDLGQDCRDPLEEFLSHCLNAETDGVFGLEEFLVSFQKRSIEIKRDVEGGEKDTQNQVRIMTVHASKGLEAPIVYLPDTIGYPDRGKLSALQWLTGASGGHFPLWGIGKGGKCSAYQVARNAQYEAAIAEYHRLLYVALTRPRDRLYVMGEQKAKGTPKPDCWYHAVSSGFDRMEATTDARTGRKVIQSPQAQAAKPNKDAGGAYKPAALPDWLGLAPVTVDKTAIKIINPSRLSPESEAILSPILSPSLRGDNKRFLRGNLTHRLFEILPDLPAEKREAAGAAFLTRLGGALDVAVRKDILKETLQILGDPVFADVFGPESRAEVPISGPIGGGQVINGQIDRLVVTEKQVIVIDFKTNRPSPIDANQIPAEYRAQLASYKIALRLIYPEKEIICALLWTDRPLLMPVNV